MKKVGSIIVIFFILLNSIFAESNIEKFWALMDEKNDEAVEIFLSNWEKENKKDAELYVAYFNFYLEKATQNQIYFETELPTNYDSYMKVQNENGEDGYMYFITEYDDEMSAKAFEYIDKGLSYNPKRLDMYFGKAHLYYLRKEYKKQCELLKNIFALDKKNKSKWLWSNNTPTKEVGVDFETSMHEYIGKWLNEKSTDSIQCAKELSVEFIKYYPKNPIAYNDAAICSIYSNDLKAAKEYFESGYELDKTDMIILANLANVSKNLGETEEAIKYYKLLEQSTDEKYSSMAKRQLESLQ